MPIDQERLARIIAMREAGKTLEQIGEAEGISRQRVGAILSSYAPGVEPPPAMPPPCKLTELMREACITPGYLANAAGLGLATVNEIIGRTPRIGTAKAICDVLTEQIGRTITVGECFGIVEADVEGESHD